MQPAARVFVLALVLAVSAISLSADSRPALSGTVAGIELCPQSICGFALFVGGFEGEVNSNTASGGFVGAITHEALPPVFGTSAITGGEFTITAGRRVIEGDVGGGTIQNLNGTQFCVTMQLEPDKGGLEDIYFTGLLDHGPFPPIITGILSEAPLPCSLVVF